MQPILRLCLAIAAAMLPTFVVLYAIKYKRRQWSGKSKAPFEELRRRPAGEGLRENLERFDESIPGIFMMLMLIPYVAGAMLGVGPQLKGAHAGLLLFSAGWSAFYGRRLYRKLRERADYQLGFDGERFVGEELNRLVAHEFEVYHDVQFDGFNIDHVLLGPQGLFSVETKTRRKPLTQYGAKQFRVNFDGVSLHWPWGRDEYGVRQAIENARTLSKWLSGATGDSVAVTPILTLPGWMVENTIDPRQAKVQVLNPKQIVAFCTSRPEQLSPTQIQRLRYQLDQRCKLTLT